MVGLRPPLQSAGRDKIAEKFVTYRFLMELNEIIHWKESADESQRIWKCLQATPKQQAEAIVKCLETSKPIS